MGTLNTADGSPPDSNITVLAHGPDDDEPTAFAQPSAPYHQPTWRVIMPPETSQPSLASSQLPSAATLNSLSSLREARR